MNAISRQMSTIRAGRAAAAWLAAASCVVLLSACKTDQGAVDQVAVSDYHERYPIVAAKAPTTLEVFATNGGLDAESIADLNAFADRYKRFGAGRIAILTPSNQRRGAVVTAIRKTLFDAGVRGAIAVGSYPNYDSAAIAPVRLSFQGLVATVPAKCGDFPHDLASGPDTSEWVNTPYENFGCSVEKMVAAQIDDPRDVVQARAPGDVDVEMRLRAIENVRKGSDPGTAWKVQNTTIGSVGGS